MPKKITFAEFQALLENPETPDREIAKYLRPVGSKGFSPVFEANPDLVEADPFESGMTIGNWWCRNRRRRRFRHRVSQGINLPVIVSEGDSWFQFPFLIEEVIDNLENDYLIWSCGAAGDTAQNMIFDNPEYMQALNDQAERVTALLLSAAGNDVIGADEEGNSSLTALLHKKTPSRRTAHQLINKTALKEVLGKLRDGYETVVATVRADERFQDLPVIFHGYDYALPFPARSGDPRNPGYADKNQWLGAPMDAKLIKGAALRRDIIEILIDELYKMLFAVAATDPNVHVVDVRGTLTKVQDWADEIHGTSAGFKRVATKFRDTLKAVIEPRPLPFETAAAADTTAADAELILDGIEPIEPPPLLIETRSEIPIDPSEFGFGDLDKFANGFRRTAARISETVEFEAIVDQDDSLAYRFLTTGTARGMSVCKINAAGIDFRGRSGRWSGTGFLVAPHILLTNQHVLNTPAVAANAQAVFNFQETTPGSMDATTTFTLDPQRLYVASRFNDLDYCFVWVNGEPHRRFGTISFWRGSSMAPPRSPANIIHHPQGRPKRASLKDNEVIPLGLKDIVVHYTTDTEPGSSGAPVMNDDWRLFALHHSSMPVSDPGLLQKVSDAGYTSHVVNEGIKTSAIAIDIDRRAKNGPDPTMARTVQDCISGTDSKTGFFGALGREVSGATGMEAVVNTYRGASDDVDVAFWNIEWFNRHYHEKINDVARIIADLNLDIWAFEETSPEATEALVEKMSSEFGLEFAFAASEPDARSSKQTTTVMWNSKLLHGGRLDWPADIDRLMKLRSDDPEADRFEAVEGKIFNRYPGLFRFTTVHPGPSGAPFDFNLVPLHLKARAEGGKRRRMASKVLATAVAMMAEHSDQPETDWIFGGDVNAELSTGQFDALKTAGFVPMSAGDERGGAITYLGRRFRSLIDTIFLSPSLARTTNADDFMIIAADREHPGFIDRVSDHRPVMIRLSLGATPQGPSGLEPVGGGASGGLVEDFLAEIRRNPSAVLARLADLTRD